MRSMLHRDMSSNFGKTKDSYLPLISRKQIEKLLECSRNESYVDFFQNLQKKL